MTNGLSLSRRIALRRRRLAAAFKRNESGAAALEFALVAPMFFMLMFVIAETALIFVAEQVMDNAVFDSARLVRTGQAQNASMTKEQFKTNVCDRMSVFINCTGTDFYLDVKSYDSFAAMDVGAPIKTDETFEDEGTYNFGQSSDIVVVRAYYQWPTNPIFGALSLKNMNNGKRLIGSFAAFCNEPYQVGQSSSGGCG